MSGIIHTNIKSIVNALKDITWEQVIFEAITNSLQANATEIKIKFIQKSLDLNNTKKYVERIIIEDNGDGFNKDNTNSFKTYLSTHKKDLGAKGIGRFLYLKKFNEINIESLDKKIHFVIDKDIEVNNLNEQIFNKTFIYFNKPKINFVVDFEELEQKIRDHFIVYFKLYKKQASIKLFENDIEKVKIKSSNIDINKIANENLKKSIEEAPFLVNYLEDNENILSSESILLSK